MKKLFNSLAVAVLVCAGISAYATAKNTVLDVVYYDNGPACVEARAEKCLNTGDPDCVKPVFATDGTTFLGNFQIYAQVDPSTPANCATAYRP